MTNINHPVNPLDLGSSSDFDNELLELLDSIPESDSFKPLSEPHEKFGIEDFNLKLYILDMALSAKSLDEYYEVYPKPKSTPVLSLIGVMNTAEKEYVRELETLMDYIKTAQVKYAKATKPEVPMVTRSVVKIEKSVDSSKSDLLGIRSGDDYMRFIFNAECVKYMCRRNNQTITEVVPEKYAYHVISKIDDDVLQERPSSLYDTTSMVVAYRSVNCCTHTIDGSDGFSTTWIRFKN